MADNKTTGEGDLAPQQNVAMKREQQLQQTGALISNPASAGFGMLEPGTKLYQTSYGYLAVSPSGEQIAYSPSRNIIRPPTELSIPSQTYESGIRPISTYGKESGVSTHGYYSPEARAAGNLPSTEAKPVITDVAKAVSSGAVPGWVLETQKGKEYFLTEKEANIRAMQLSPKPGEPGYHGTASNPLGLFQAPPPPKPGEWGYHATPSLPGGIVEANFNAQMQEAIYKVAFAPPSPGLQKAMDTQIAEQWYKGLSPIEKAGALIVGGFNKPIEVGGGFFEAKLFGGGKGYQSELYKYEIVGAKTIDIPFFGRQYVPKTSVVTESGIGIGSAFAMGAIFKGGTILARSSLRSASSSIGSNIVAQGLTLAEKAVEPVAVLGGLGYAGSQVYGTYQKAGKGAALAQVGYMGVTIPLAMAGWKSTGELYSAWQVRGRTEVPAPVSPEVLSGAKQFPTTAPGTTPKDVIMGFKTEQGTLRGYHATGESLGKELQIANVPSRPSDIGGLYVSPHQFGASPYFLRVNPEYGGGLKEMIKGFGASEPLKPTVMDIQIFGAGRLPKGARSSVEQAREFMGMGAEPGKAYLTPKLETTLRGGGMAEAEGVISPGTVLGKTVGTKYFTYKGMRIPIDQYEAMDKVISGKAVKSEVSTISEESYGYGYRRSAIPSIPSSVVSSIMQTFTPKTARAEQQALYEVASKEMLSNFDISGVVPPKSPVKIETKVNQLRANEISKKLAKDLQGLGIAAEARGTRVIQKGKPSDVLGVVDYFDRAKVDMYNLPYSNLNLDRFDMYPNIATSGQYKFGGTPGDIGILGKYYGNNFIDTSLMGIDVPGLEDYSTVSERIRSKLRRGSYGGYRPTQTRYRKTGRRGRTPYRKTTYTPEYRKTYGYEKVPTYTPPYTPGRTPIRTPQYTPPRGTTVEPPYYPPVFKMPFDERRKRKYTPKRKEGYKLSERITPLIQPLEGIENLNIFKMPKHRKSRKGKKGRRQI